VTDLDQLLTESPRSVMTIKNMMQRYLPAQGCDVANVIAVSNASKFFNQLNEYDLLYVIIFQSSDFLVMFGLKKDTGDIETPSARVRGRFL